MATNLVRVARERLCSGFFITEQNRTLLTNADGSFTDRGNKIIAHTPFARFGEPKNCSERFTGLPAMLRSL
jgi:hypothetical protein